MVFGIFLRRIAINSLADHITPVLNMWRAYFECKQISGQIIMWLCKYTVTLSVQNPLYEAQADSFSFFPFFLYKVVHNHPSTLLHSVDVPRGVGSQLLPDHREAGGGGAGVPDRGGAHLQPLLCAAGEVCRLLWRRKPGVSSHPNHKRHHAGTGHGQCHICLILHCVYCDYKSVSLLKILTHFVPQLLKIRPSEPDKEYVEMTFVEHQTCECR